MSEKNHQGPKIMLTVGKRLAVKVTSRSAQLHSFSKLSAEGKLRDHEEQQRRQHELPQFHDVGAHKAQVVRQLGGVMRYSVTGELGYGNRPVARQFSYLQTNP